RYDAWENPQSRDGVRPAPRVLAIERLIEVEDAGELLARVGRLAHEKAEVDEREHDVAEIRSTLDSPALEDEARHDAEAVEREITGGERELLARDVPALGQALLAELEGREHEEIRALVIPRLTQPDLVHDPVT